MPDFADIDRQLAALGAAPADARALLGRALGEDRSRVRLDALLAELSQAWTPAPLPPPPRRRASSHPPRALGRHHVRIDPLAARTATRPSGKRNTLVGLPSSAPPEPFLDPVAAHTRARPASEPQRSDAARAEAEADTDLHRIAAERDTWADPDTDPGAALGPGPEIELSVDAAAPLHAASGDRHPSTRPPAPESDNPAAPSVMAALDAQQAALDESARKRESQRVMRALLEQDLDPKDFADPPVPAEAAADDELELVVEEEEEEILELDDIELVEDDE